MTKTARVLVLSGCVLLLAGLLAGFVNRELLDAKRFAEHADAVRQDDAVARQAGIRITDALLTAEPDLTALRPVLESTGAAVFGSPAFGPVVEGAVEPVHRAFFDSGDDQVVLRLADAGVILTAVAEAHAPELAAQLPSDLDVTLAQVADHSFAARTIRTAHVVSTLAWLLPVAALLCFAGAAALTRSLRDTMRLASLATAALGLALAVVVLVTSIVLDRVETDTMSRAVLVAGWDQLSGPLLQLAVAVTAAGLVAAYATELAMGTRRTPGELLADLAARRDRTGWRLTVAGGLTALGVAVVLEPLTVVRVVLVMAGAAIAVLGLVWLLDVAADLLAERRQRRATADHPRSPWSRRGARVTGVACLVVVVAAAGTTWNGHRGATELQPPRVATVCNGSAALCDRPYDEVVFPGTHNSMSAADEPGWLFAEQPTGVIGQLDDGIRVFLIDTWYGRRTDRRGRVATAGPSRAEAEKEFRQTYGKAALTSALRIIDTLKLTPVGPTEPYLCHSMCELGAVEWEPLMEEVRDWLAAHPQEVVTFFLQDQISPAATAEVFSASGLLPVLHTPTPGEPWPTLGEMVTSGRRVVVLSENESGGTDYPWLLPGFTWVQDTPFDGREVEDLGCEPNRGAPDAPLFLVNHWLNNVDRRVSDAATVNAADVLGARLDRCVRERRPVTYVAVDFYDLGDLFGEVDRLNGVSPE